MAGNALPLLMVAGLAVTIGSKKKKKKSSSRISGNFGDYSDANPESINIAVAQAAINKYSRQVWIITLPNHPGNAELRKMMKAAAARRPDMGFALVNCELFIPYEGAEACTDRGGDWELRTSDGSTLQDGKVDANFQSVLNGLIDAGSISTGSTDRPPAQPQPTQRPPFQPPAPKPPEQKADPRDPNIPYVEYYSSVPELMAAKEHALYERPAQNYFMLLIKNMQGLSEDAVEAMYEWAEGNWGDDENIGWTLMIAPTGPNTPEEYAVDIYRSDLGDLSKYFFHVFATPDGLLGGDASTWTKADVLAALDGATGDLPSEAFDKLLQAADAAEAGA
jgi:hypothetical protein